MSNTPSSASAIRLDFDSDPRHVKGARLACEKLARDVGFDELGADAIGLVVNEALANVIEHAYGFEKGRPIVLRAEAGEGGVVIRIRDWGRGVDPSKLPPKPKDPLEPGGLGLVCMREMMDEVRYAPQADGGIELTMVKKLR